MRTGMFDSLRRVRELERSGKDEEKRTLLRQTEERHPELYWLVEGRILLKKGDHAGAEDALRKAVKLDPRSVEAHVDLGRCLLTRKKDEEAIESFRRALQIEPSYGPAHLHLGRCLRALGRRDAALAALRSAVQYMPLDGATHRELAEALVEAGRNDEALTHARHAVRLDAADRQAAELLERLQKPSSLRP
jgi:tetratricopeptide (TPR) repeat protein